MRGRGATGVPGGGDLGLRASLAAAWPPADGPAGDHRRASLAGTRIVAATALPGGGALVLARREDADGLGTWTLVPVVSEGEAWRRAVAGDGVAAALVRALRDGTALGGGFELERWGSVEVGASDLAERSIGVDQTNETVVVDERVGVKWLRHPDAERDRAPRLLRHLGAAGFRDVPPTKGILSWRPSPGELSLTLALVDAWLPGSRDGWDWCTDALLAHSAGAHGCDAACPARFAAALGTLLARLHLALATPTPVIPEPVGRVGRTVIDGWARTARAALREAITVTAADDAAAGAELRTLAPALRAAIDGLGSVAAAVVQPVHGDLHVGQVLQGPHGLAVLDFDGNPTAAAASLHTRAPAARDVAGMLCSLDHVGRIAIRRGADERRVESWIDDASMELLTAYRGALAGAGRADLLDDRLLAPFRVEQECHELLYAARFLPRWRYAAMGSIRAIVAWR